jgi:hypothetical protein
MTLATSAAAALATTTAAEAVAANSAYRHPRFTPPNLTAICVLPRAFELRL